MERSTWAILLGLGGIVTGSAISAGPQRSEGLYLTGVAMTVGGIVAASYGVLVKVKEK
jgi:hypothetical protein